jgi:hypothetical protein
LIGLLICRLIPDWRLIPDVLLVPVCDVQIRGDAALWRYGLLLRPDPAQIPDP